MNTGEEYRPAVEEIRAEGERLLGQPIPELTYTLFSMYESRGSRLEFERVYFEKRRRLTTFGLLTQLEPERPEFREALQDAIWSILNEYTWCLPAHLSGSVETDGSQPFAVDGPGWSRGERGTRIDLFAAETGFALSEIWRMCEAWLPPLIASRIAEEVVRRLFKPYLLHGPYHWETAEHNWSAVCAGSIASAALYMIQDPVQLAPIIEKALASMERYLAGFGEDGACLEGIGYWNYGFGFFVYFADLLAKRTDGGIDLFRQEKVRRIAQFQQKAYLDGDIAVNFSDSMQRAKVHIGLTHYLAAVFPADVAAPPAGLRASYTDDHCSRWAPAVRNLLWFAPGQSGASWEPADYVLPNAQWLVSRHESAAGSFGFAAKGGHNDEPHNHNDLGHFILTACGEVFLCDLGSGEYTNRYFGPDRYTYDCNGSQGHSVPIVDGQLQMAGPSSAAICLEAEIGGGEDTFALDLTKAYHVPHVSSFVRSFTWRKAELPRLLLEDLFVFAEKPSELVERFVTKLEPVIGDEGMVTVTGGNGRTLWIGCDPLQLRPSVSKHSYRDHFGQDTAWYAIDFAVRQPERQVRVTLSFQFQ
ncbi:hypothetical protein ACFFK0_25840 [Paenibacillus chartarius]|uniref:Heparinase II/III-like protein n=1 Tax=Paenibacillus chartarius TaxID=747481 RepID=A0ABV6DTF9_9BACL